jgi:ADP-ribosyl-[dinitrogen reductase] hydrolase
MLNTAGRDRAVGLMVGLATGDALGAGYEFGPALDPHDIAMIGGGLGPFEPGEWTDDTSMALPLLEAIADGADLLDPATQDRVAADWVAWAGEAKDVGVATRSVLSTGVRAVDLRAAADRMFAETGHAAGNGSLMRTGPIALAYLEDPVGLTEAATAYSHMTHGDPECAQACVLWNHAQRHAVLTGELDIRVGLSELESADARRWEVRIQEAENGRPTDFPKNGWVVHAFQAAWSAIATTGDGGPQHFENALRGAVSAGNDTDTVGAIAGGLLGARWGVSAVPLGWRRMLHGWPEIIGQDLVWLVLGALGQPRAARFYDPSAPVVRPVPHPHDDGVLLGDVHALRDLPDDVDAVVSLCRIGSEEGPSRPIPASDHIQVWLVDDPAPAQNPHLEFVAEDAVGLIAQLREEGKTVYLHCVHAHSRTPFIAALYSVRERGVDPATALRDVTALLPAASPNPAFLRYLSGQG